jgi:hypothetical protein
MTRQLYTAMLRKRLKPTVPVGDSGRANYCQLPDSLFIVFHGTIAAGIYRESTHSNQTQIPLLEESTASIIANGYTDCTMHCIRRRLPGIALTHPFGNGLRSGAGGGGRRHYRLKSQQKLIWVTWIKTQLPKKVKISHRSNGRAN